MRARELLESNLRQNLLYSALELRLGVEARVQSYIQANEQISKEIKRGYHAGKLTKALKATHSDGKFVAEFSFNVPVNDQVTWFTFHFIPLSENLQSLYNKLGGYLHYKENDYDFSDLWWDELKLLLYSGIKDLEICSNGGLLGVPLWKKSTNEIKVMFELPPEDSRYEKLEKLAEIRMHQIMNVKYIDTEEYYKAARNNDSSMHSS